jgi:hypothetical protein
MCAAFPRSDYYGGSAPRPRHRRTCRLAGLRVPGARIEVPVFAGGTRGAVGGWLYPWQRGPPTQSGHGGGVPIAGTPSLAEIATGRWLHPSLARVFAPYRGFHRHLQLRVAPPRFTLAPVVARLEAEAPLRAVQTVRLLQAAGALPATFTVPFCTRPDPGEDDIFLS